MIQFDLPTALILGFILHLIGDYVLQNDWMAQNKVKKWVPALVHATVYSLPFLLLCWSWWWLMLYLTHLVIDRFRLAVYWIKMVNWNWESKNFGYDDAKPAYISLWLMIAIDNTFHIIFNTVSIWMHYN